jgi:diaminopimelate epimerase
MRFVKMHGLGNDYVYLDGFTQAVDDPAALAVKIADRHFGVGGDGLILVGPPSVEAATKPTGTDPGAGEVPGAGAIPGAGAGARMRMFNADGSEAEMCGNGIRCVCKFIHDHRLGPASLHRSNPMHIETGAGVLTLDYELDEQSRVANVAVDMGTPVLDLKRVPVEAERLDDRLAGAVFVSMGNPHAVFYIDDPETELTDPVRGAELERHPAFPNRMNVHFVRVRSEAEVQVYHWERGSGATLACGTGACAVAVAGVLTGRTSPTLTAHLPGGPLRLEWVEFEGQAKDAHGGRVIMTGPATEVFVGDWPA